MAIATVNPLNGLTFMPAFLAYVDGQGRLTNFNRRLVDICGASEGEIRSRPVRELLTPSDWNELLAHIPELKAGRTVRHHFLHRPPNGRIVHLEVSIYPELDEHGRLHGAFAVGMDVTHRAGAEPECRSTVARLQRVADLLPTALVEIDRNGKVRFCNRALRRVAALSGRKIVGRRVGELLPQAALQRVEPDLRKALSGEAVQRASRLRTADGGRADMLLTYVPVRGRNGIVESVIGCATDVTMVRNLERMRSEFVASVNHELRTPLATILSSLQMLRRGVAAEQTVRLVDAAARSGERMSRLLDDLLEADRVESSEARFCFRTVELLPLMLHALDEHEGLAAAHGVNLLGRLSLGATRVTVDSDRLTQVIGNLLSNAIKFSPPGGVVRVSARARSRDVLIAVKDHGPGIPEQFRSRMFSRFARLDTDGRKTPGSGLGLVIAKSIVLRLGGTIDYHSIHGVGTTFHVRLPLATQTDSRL